MTLGLDRRVEILSWVDAEKGTVDWRMFSDPEIFDAEMEHIFARAWNFMAHDSQIPNPGDFFLTSIGEDRVIVVRDKAGNPQVLLNTCRHRGNAVCRAEEGHATSFMCTYHGWTYDLQGKLVGVPGFKDYYHEDLDRTEWGLVRAAQVDTYRGFIFATLDEEAPPLDEYLGEVGRISLTQFALRGDIMVVSGIQKFTIQCNWKFAAENGFDFYHPQLTHASAAMSGWRGMPGGGGGRPAGGGRGMPNHIVLLGEYGHAVSGPEAGGFRMPGTNGGAQDYRDKPEVRAELGSVGVKVLFHPHIFPNMWLTGAGFGQVCMRMPRTATNTEMWFFTFTEKNLGATEREELRLRDMHVLGPAGMLEQEDGENWAQSTRGAMGTVASRYPLHYGMNLGRGEIIENEDGPPSITTHVNEHGQLWLYRAWAEWMAADGWADLKANHSPVPSGFV